MPLSIRLSALALLVVAAVGCRKDPLNNLTPAEQRIYITNTDRTANFSDYRTFSISDRVVVVEDGGSRQQLTSADQALIASLNRALQSRRFTAVGTADKPDLGVQISRIVRTSTGFVSAPDYWGYWDPTFWGPGAGWGPGFGWGPGMGPGWGVVPYEVREGMLAIDIIDLKNNNNRLRVLWNALVRGPGLASASEVEDIVNNLMQQSPQLKTN